MKKKILSLFLALTLCLGLTVPALAAEGALTEVIPCKYDDAGSFSEGMAVVGIGDWEICKYGYIDTTGKEVVPCKYDEVNDFSEGMAAVRIGDYGTGKYGYIDKTGKEVVPCKYDRAYDFSEGMAAVMLNGKRGYIDKTGGEVIPCKYDDVGGFSEGMAWVCVDTGEKTEWGEPMYKYGFVDKTGKEVVPCKYNEVKDFSEGLAAVVLDGKVGFIDKTGKEIVPCKYDAYWQMVAAGDEMMTREIYQYSFSEGMAWVCVDTGEENEWGESMYKWGYIDTTGKEVIPCKYDDVGSFSEGMARVCVDTGEDEWGNPIYKWGYIDITGKEVVPCKYDEVKDFSEGMAVVRLGSTYDGKSGFIDKTGKEVVPCKYDRAYDFSEGMAAVRLNGKWGFISVNGATSTSTTITSTGILPQATGTAHASTQNVGVDGAATQFQMYALKDTQGGETNYVKLRDLADALDGTSAQFNVTWSEATGIGIETGKAYTTRNGQENKTPYSGDRAYKKGADTTMVNGVATGLQAFVLTDDNGGESTYYQLRDLGKALGFNVGWSEARGVFIETDKPYTDAD